MSDPDGSRRRPPGYFELRRDLQRPGCVVCRGANRSATRFIDALLWERVTDARTRTELRDSDGFCRDHWLLAVDVAGASAQEVGLGIVAEDLLTRTVERVADVSPRRRRARTRRGRPVRRCPACRSADATALLYLELLAGGHPELEPDGDRLPSLCLPHLRVGLSLGIRAPGDERLRSVYVAGARKVATELREYIRKHDHRFRHEPMSPSEARAWADAARLIAGWPVQRVDDR